jgi:hypothetical protein
MKLTGGKRKVNKSLKSWVAFVKKVQKQEKLSYKEAIHRAKVRKDKGEKWMKGGDADAEDETTPDETTGGDDDATEVAPDSADEEQAGGRKRRRSRKRRQSRKSRRSRRR